MNVSSKTIIHKMVKEITEAKKSLHDDAQMMHRVANIKVLCDLLLDEYHQTQQRNEPTDDIILPTTTKEVTPYNPSVTKTEHDDGTSIFDF